MPQPTQYPNAWHNAEDAQERVWLDDWMRGQICPASLDTCPTRQPATELPPTAAGSC